MAFVFARKLSIILFIESGSLCFHQGELLSQC